MSRRSCSCIRPKPLKRFLGYRSGEYGITSHSPHVASENPTWTRYVVSVSIQSKPWWLNVPNSSRQTNFVIGGEMDMGRRQKQQAQVKAREPKPTEKKQEKKPKESEKRQ